jgi:hypothetical protein
LFATNKVVAKRNARASFFIAMSPHEVIVLWNAGAWKNLTSTPKRQNLGTLRAGSDPFKTRINWEWIWRLPRSCYHGGLGTCAVASKDFISSPATFCVVYIISRQITVGQREFSRTSIL